LLLVVRSKLLSIFSPAFSTFFAQSPTVFCDCLIEESSLSVFSEASRVMDDIVLLLRLVNVFAQCVDSCLSSYNFLPLWIIPGKICHFKIQCYPAFVHYFFIC